jgi:hypothetical protein
MLASQAACFPAMLHGPRVERGGSLTANVSTATGPQHTEGDYGGIRLRNESVGLGFGYGWRGNTPSEPSLFLGAYVPVLFPFAQLDLFVQAPEAWSGPTAGGLGVNVAIDHVQPYLQWGMMSANGTGWSILQGVSVRSDGSAQAGQVSWMPGVAAHIGRGQHRVHLYAMGAFGRLRGNCYADGRNCAGERTYALLGGVAYQFRFRRD